MSRDINFNKDDERLRDLIKGIQKSLSVDKFSFFIPSLGKKVSYVDVVKELVEPWNGFYPDSEYAESVFDFFKELPVKLNDLAVTTMSYLEPVVIDFEEFHEENQYLRKVVEEKDELIKEKDSIIFEFQKFFLNNKMPVKNINGGSSNSFKPDKDFGGFNNHGVNPIEGSVVKKK